MVGRLLLWAIVAFVAWWLLRPRRKPVPPPAGAGAGPAGRGAPPAPPEAMVDCAACGLHFPASEAVHDGGHVYCCTAHRDAGPRRDG
jgi:uncharacterized protein